MKKMASLAAGIAPSMAVGSATSGHVSPLQMPPPTLAVAKDDKQFTTVQDCAAEGSAASAYLPLGFIIAMSNPAHPRGVPGTGAGIAGDAVRQIADRIPRPRKQGARISEQDTKRVLITPAIEALGWDIYDTDEVRNEYRHKSADNPVDYALFLNRSPVLFVEAKPLGQSLEDRKWIVQTINYANAAGVDWCVLTNGAEYRVYKVHAQVEADRKLFATVSLDNPDNLAGAIRVFDLLSRDNMRARAIDDLWQAWHVDRQVKEALDLVLQDDGFVALVRKRIPQIGLAEVRKSLHRANISVSYPDIFAKAIAESPELDDQPAVPPATEVRLPESGNALKSATVPAARPAPDQGEQARRRFQSTEDLFTLGRIHTGDTLTIRGRADSAARVVDGRTVSYRGDQLSFLEWGKRVTGWKAVQIYTIAILADGRTLDQLRDDPQSPPATP